jgi:hypothetical protein
LLRRGRFVGGLIGLLLGLNFGLALSIMVGIPWMFAATPIVLSVCACGIGVASSRVAIDDRISCLHL